MSFKKRLLKNETLYGAIISITSPCVTEIFSHCGFDWLWIDMEHAPFTLADVQAMAQAANKNTAIIVRIPINSEEWVKRTLELGIDGIIVPHVNTKQEVENIVDVSLYPPEGRRSMGMARASQYGMDRDYIFQANKKRSVFIQIEHKEGVGNIEEIVKVPGLDGIIIGPYDLSGSYNKPGQVEDKEVVAAIGKVLKVCKKHKKPIGIFAKDAETAKRYAKMGFQLIAVGVDVHYLWTSALASREALK